MEDAAPPEVEEQIIGSNDILGEEKRDDTKDVLNEPPDVRDT
jgi:hypothetical protein